MLVIKSTLVIICAFVPCVFNNNQDFDMKSTLKFATKSPYLFKEQTIFNYDDYTPRKIWAMFRHGTRFPGKKTISKYFGLADHIGNLQSSNILSNDEKRAFLDWKPLDIDLAHQKFLTKEGEEELVKIGARFRNQFLHHFNEKDTKFTFKHTPTQRTHVSARKFIEGLFQNNSTSHEIIEVARDDPIIRPYKGCPLWRKEVKKNPNALIEKKALINSEHIENLVNEMREITQIQDLNFKDVELMYTMCGFETAWRHSLHNEKSIWCSLFKNENHLNLMEYLEDMEYYWIDGPGFEVTRKVACNTVKDMLNHLDPSTPDKSLSFYFTHSGTMLKLMTFLELYKDDFQLTADKLNHQRLWKTSVIDNFATNIVVVLYDSNKYGPHVQMLHQEDIIQIPHCQSNSFGMCSFENFKDFYGEKTKECNLSAICNKNDEL